MGGQTGQHPLHDVSVKDVCPTISHRFRLTEGGDEDRDRTLIVSFSGVYRVGSEGNPDAEYMRAMVELGLHLWWWVGSLVVDISELDYEFGDLIDIALQRNEFKPTAIVVGSNCEGALASLWFGYESGRRVTDEEDVFDSLDDAIDYVRSSQAKPCRRAIPPVV